MVVGATKIWYADCVELRTVSARAHEKRGFGSSIQIGSKSYSTRMRVTLIAAAAAAAQAARSSLIWERSQWHTQLE